MSAVVAVRGAKILLDEVSAIAESPFTAEEARGLLSKIEGIEEELKQLFISSSVSCLCMRISQVKIDDGCKVRTLNWSDCLSALDVVKNPLEIVLHGPLSKGKFKKVRLKMPSKTGEYFWKAIRGKEARAKKLIHDNCQSEVRVVGSNTVRKYYKQNNHSVNREGWFHLILDHSYVVSAHAILRDSIHLKRYDHSLCECIYERSCSHLSGEGVKKNILKQVAEALVYLKSKRVIHLDLKPANLMIDGERCVKLGDFGGSVLGKPPVGFRDISYTKGYVAPEIYWKGRITHKADVWSYGVVSAEVVFERLVEGVELESLTDPSDPYNEDAVIKRIFQRCLVHDAKERASIQDVIEIFEQVVEISAV